MSTGFPWNVLGIGSTTDRKAIRAAYAAKLKALDVDKDVEGYARLRSARDEALARAKEAQAADDPPLVGDPLADSITGPEPVELPSDEEQLDTGTDPQAEYETASETPNKLLAILFPDNEYSDAALTAKEYEQAEALTREVIAEAQGSAVDKQHAIENWLAHYLASAWPRSGPLVEEAVEGFGWNREAGLIDENPAVAFLNNRLTSIRFMNELDQPSSPFHRAWNELRKPGEKGWMPFVGPSQDSVQQLVMTIRQDYPDLEEFLSPQRVESWIDPQPTSPWKTWLAGVAVFWFITSVFRFAMSDSHDRDLADPAPAMFAADWSDEERADLLDRLFGPGVNYDDLVQDAPIVWEVLERLTSQTPEDARAREYAFEEAQRVLRFQSQRAAASAGFEDLVAIKEARLQMLLMAREQADANACLGAAVTAELPGNAVPTSEYEARETSLFRRLLEADLYQYSDAALPEQASIPGAVVLRVMQDAGMSSEKFNEVARGDGNTAERCDYRIAMLRAILARPGDVPEDLLRMM